MKPKFSHDAQEARRNCARSIHDASSARRRFHYYSRFPYISAICASREIFIMRNTTSLGHVTAHGLLSQLYDLMIGLRAKAR